MTAVFGGSDSLSFWPAEACDETKLKEFTLPQLSDVYHNGGEFKGMLFDMYAERRAARKVIQKMHGKGSKQNQGGVKRMVRKFFRRWSVNDPNLGQGIVQNLHRKCNGNDTKKVREVSRKWSEKVLEMNKKR